jgi:hypothetical protein
MTHPLFEVQYLSLEAAEHDLRFPCDPQGRVDLDGLSPQAVENYLFARALVGRSFAPPALVECEPQ